MTDDKNNTFGEFGARSTKFDELLKKYQTIDEDSEVFPAPENEDESVTSTPEKQEFQISMPENSETKTPKSRIKKKRSANNKSVKLTDKKDTSEKAKTKKKKVAQPEIEQPEIEQTEIDKFDFDMSEQEVEQFDFAMDEYEIEKFDLEMNELEEIVTAQSEPEEPETEVYEPQQVDFVEEEPVQFNFSLPELEEYESELPESERFDFSKDFDLLVSEQPEEVQSEPEQFDFGASELEQINEIQPEEFDFAIEETEQFDLESEQFDEIQPEIEQLDEAQTEPEQLEYVQPEQFEETQYEAEQLDYTQPEYETGFSFDDQSVQMQSSDEGPDEPDYSYDLDMFGTHQTKSSIDIDSFDDSWLETALDRTLFYNAVRPSQYDMPEPATYVPVDVEKDPFEPNVKPITQENGFVEQFPEEADKNAMAGGYIAPSDFSDFNFDPDSGMDFDYEEKNAYMQNFSAAENTDGLIYNEESEKKKSEKTKQPASRIFQRIIKPPKERDQKKTD